MNPYKDFFQAIIAKCSDTQQYCILIQPFSFFKSTVFVSAPSVHNVTLVERLRCAMVMSINTPLLLHSY